MVVGPRRWMWLAYVSCDGLGEDGGCSMREERLISRYTVFHIITFVFILSKSLQISEWK